MSEPPPTLRMLAELARTSPASVLLARLGTLALVGPPGAPGTNGGQLRIGTEYSKRGPDAPDPMADFFDNLAIGLLPRPGSTLASVLIVGRAQDCDVWIDDSSVSKRHACIVVEDEGAHVVSDSRSTNGTWVNDVQLDEREERLLVDGTRLRFGDRAFTVRSVATLHQMLSRFAPTK